MKILNDVGCNNKETMNNALDEALTILKIPNQLRKEAKDWYPVRHKISELMTNRIRGRTTPSKASKLRPSLESKKMLKTHLFSDIIYPHNVTTNKKKVAHLQKMKKNGEIKEVLFKELMGVLR